MDPLRAAAEEALSPEQAADAGAVSLTAYGHLFFPRTFRQESPEFHEVIGQGLYSPARFNAFEVFRDGAKTTLLRVYKSQRISYGLSRTIMYVSVSQPHAKMSVRWLRRQVQYNRRWTQTFGLEKGEKWSDEHCEIIHRNMPPNEDGSPVIITVLAMGITGQIRGFNPDDFRPDLIIIDDVLDEENTATPEQRKKIENLIFGAILNSLAPASESPLAKAVFLQTPFNKEDAIEKCMSDPEWNPIRFGILEYGVPGFGEGRSRWERRYPTEQVLASKRAHIRRSQYRLWMREKECSLVSGEEKALDITKLKFFDVLPEYLDTVVSFDPASSESPKADDFAIGAVGFKGLDVYLLDYTAEKGVMPDAAMNDGFNLSLLYHPRKWVVESVAYQKIMAWYAREEMIKRRMFYAVEELKVRTSNADRIMQTLPGLLSFGHLHCRPHHSKFISQADDYDPQVKDIKDDILTMLANAIIASNPALRANLTDDTKVGYIDNEDDYQPLVVRGSP